VLREKSVANGYTAEVKAENFRASRTKGVDDLDAPAAQIDMKTRAKGGGEGTGGERDDATFLVTAQKPNRIF
jgi:hypothetical protein